MPGSSEQSVFLEALDIEDEQARRDYVDRACGADADLRTAVEALLVAHDRLRPIANEPGVVEQPGTLIGQYKLIERIGEGGFGVVFLAEQHEPVRRKVALKIIKPGMDTQQVIARFEAERQALALMDHPHIARVLDGGATNGRPYFVMELIRGVPITEYCDKHRLTPPARLGLFMDVCRAVAHAHQKGIIHRDVKPGNILVTLIDGKPVVKVIDFGVAKAMGQQLTDKTLHTGFRQLIGSPLYMSPEQAEMCGQDVDTRADIYALGVLLYELLTGTTPFDRERLTQAAFDEIRRIIREEDPPRPSTRIGTLGAKITTVSDNRGTDPRRLGLFIRGDLDWIVMKCLEKDRTRRYETASNLCRDVERFLTDEPIEARPPSSLYRLRKFARRHKTGFVLAAVVGVLIAAAFVVLAVSNIVIDGERRETKKALEAETKAKDEMQAALGRERQALNALRLSLARAHWLVGDVASARKHLLECALETRDRSWLMLERACNGEVWRVKLPASNIHKMRYSDDGKLLGVVGSEVSFVSPATFYVLEAANGQGLPGLMRIGLNIQDVAFTRDRKALVAASVIGGGVSIGKPRTGTPDLRTWDIATGKETKVTPLRYFGNTLALSQDGRHAAVRASGAKIGVGASIVIIDSDSGAEAASIPAPEGTYFIDITWSPCGRFLAANTGAGHLVLWSQKKGDVRTLDKVTSHGIARMSFSPDGKRLAIVTDIGAGKTGTIRVWDLTNDREVLRIPAGVNPTLQPTFSPDGRYLASVHGDHAVVIWDLQENCEFLTFREEALRLSSLAFRPDGLQLACGSLTGIVRVWDVSPLRSK